jgi:hypothetical protein
MLSVVLLHTIVIHRYSAHAAGAFLEEAARKHVPLIKFIGKRSRQKLVSACTLHYY